MGFIKVPLFVKLLFSTLQKFGRLVLWEAMFILELHSAETQDTDRILYFKDGHIISELKRCNRERREFYEEIMQEAARQDEKR